MKLSPLPRDQQKDEGLDVVKDQKGKKKRESVKGLKDPKDPKDYKDPKDPKDPKDQKGGRKLSKSSDASEDKVSVLVGFFPPGFDSASLRNRMLAFANTPLVSPSHWRFLLDFSTFGRVLNVLRFSNPHKSAGVDNSHVKIKFSTPEEAATAVEKVSFFLSFP